MNFPDLKTLERIGRQTRHNTAEAETLVMRELGFLVPCSFAWLVNVKCINKTKP